MLRLTFDTNNFHALYSLFRHVVEGTIARLKPCLAASFIRSWPLATGRIAPDKPTSPKITKSCGRALSLKLETNARINAKSILVSVTLIPPTTLTNTSWSLSYKPAWRCNMANSMDNLFWSAPTATRRGLPNAEWSTKAWISTNKGRGSSQSTITTLPAVCSSVRLRKIA